ncbi:MAG: GNAT family N-acetyltransferase, partial [Acidimicrobiia bacterium]|nr:GNAT family N-acetyltransferase [Acidimicrobiia bacterium]
MEIRTYEPDLSNALLRFLDRQFPGTVKADPAYFDWKFAQNPLGSSLGAYYLAVEDGQVVAQVATLVDRLELGDGPLPCAWVVDLMVAPEQRGSGLVGIQLLNTLMRHHDLVLANGMGDEPLRLYEGLGWREVPGATLTTFDLVLRPGRTLAGGSDRLRRTLGVLDRPFGRYRRMTARRAAGVQQIDRVPDDVDDLVAAVAPALGPTTYRSSALYRWRFGRQPHGGTSLTFAQRDRDALRGVAVARIFDNGARRWADVADVVVDPRDRDSLRALLAAVTAAAVEHRCDAVRASVSHPALVSQLRACRWLQRRPRAADRAYVHARDGSVGARITGAQWHMTG